MPTPTLAPTTMEAEDWLDLMVDARISEQKWLVTECGLLKQLAIRNIRGECPLSALCNTVRPTGYTESFHFAIRKVFGHVVGEGADQIAWAADYQLSKLSPEYQFIRLALGKILDISQDQL